MAKKPKKPKKDKDNGGFDIKFAPLAPFKRAMLNKLKARGIKPKSEKLKDVTIAFYEAFIKKSNFEIQGSEAQQYFEVENFALTIGAVLTIVAAVLSWFKKHKEEQEEGGALDPDTERAVNEADADIAAAVANGSLPKSDGYDKDKSDDTKFGGMSIFMIIIIAVIAYFLLG